MILVYSADLLIHPAHFLFAMAPKGLRQHPYRAISNVETSVGTQTCSWYAGRGGQPAGTDPPPDRPVLIIVDISQLYTEEVTPVVRRTLGPIPVSSHCEEEVFWVSRRWVARCRDLHDPKFLSVVGIGKNLEVNLMHQPFIESAMLRRSKMMMSRSWKWSRGLGSWGG